MKILSLIVSCLLLISWIGKSKYLSDIEKGESVLLTFEPCIDWPVLNSNNEKLIFAQKNGDQYQLKSMYLNAIEIVKGYSGVYTAKYIQDGHNSDNYIKTIFSAKDTTLSQIKISPNNQRILSISDITEENQIFLLSPITLESEIVPLSDVRSADWFNTDVIVYTTNANPKKVLVYDINTQEIKEEFDLEHEVKGICSDRYNVTLTCEGGVYFSSKLRMNPIWSDVPLTGRTSFFIDNTTILTTLKDGNSSIIDLNNNITEKVLFASDDKNPVLSLDKKYIAIYSETFKGIILKVR